MMNRCKTVLFAAGLFAGLLLSTAHADTVVVTLTPSTESALPGSTVTYSATLSAPGTNAAPVYLNNNSIDLNDPVGVATDGSDLFLNFDPDLVPGESESGALFTVTLPSTAAGGIFTGDFLLQGGGDLAAQGTLDTVPFTLDVGSAASATPEPSSWMLMASGVVGVAMLGWRQRLPQR